MKALAVASILSLSSWLSEADDQVIQREMTPDEVQKFFLEYTGLNPEPASISSSSFYRGQSRASRSVTVTSDPFQSSESFCRKSETELTEEESFPGEIVVYHIVRKYIAQVTDTGRCRDVSDWISLKDSRGYSSLSSDQSFVRFLEWINKWHENLQEQELCDTLKKKWPVRDEASAEFLCEEWRYIKDLGVSKVVSVELLIPQVGDFHSLTVQFEGPLYSTIQLGFGDGGDGDQEAYYFNLIVHDDFVGPRK